LQRAQLLVPLMPAQRSLLQLGRQSIRPYWDVIRICTVTGCRLRFVLNRASVRTASYISSTLLPSIEWVQLSISE
jgi:hypothetical protein